MSLQTTPQKMPLCEFVAQILMIYGTKKIAASDILIDSQGMHLIRCTLKTLPGNGIFTLPTPPLKNVMHPFVNLHMHLLKKLNINSHPLH
jgi:hypothetical protein